MNAVDVARLHPPVLTPEQDVATALATLRDHGGENLPVVDGLDRLRLLGWLHRSDALAAFNRARMASRRE